MFICGAWEFLRRNTMSATMFTLFGAFWYAITLYNILLIGKVMDYPFTAMPKTVQTLYAFMGIVTAVMAIIVSQMALSAVRLFWG